MAPTSPLGQLCPGASLWCGCRVVPPPAGLQMLPQTHPPVPELQMAAPAIQQLSYIVQYNDRFADVHRRCCQPDFCLAARPL
jgi:hypothetical protein